MSASDYYTNAGAPPNNAPPNNAPTDRQFDQYQNQQPYQNQPYQNKPPQNQQYQNQNPQYAPEAKYNQPPPQYGPNYGGQDPASYGEKPTFNQAFKIEKPKLNDLWAGILVSL